MKFVDLHAQYERYKDEIDQAIQAVIDTTSFINGSEVQAMEEDLASFCGLNMCWHAAQVQMRCS